MSIRTIATAAGPEGDCQGELSGCILEEVLCVCVCVCVCAVTERRVCSVSLDSLLSSNEPQNQNQKAVLLFLLSSILSVFTHVSLFKDENLNHEIHQRRPSEPAAYITHDATRTSTVGLDQI